MKRILIVDDEVGFTKIMKLNLEATGNYEVTILTEAKNLIDNLHKTMPDLILLDLLMPGIGGIEACDMLNEDPLGQKTPVIILSALEKPVDKLNAFKRGVVDYIIKTTEFNEIVLKIEKAIEQKKAM